MYCPNSSTRSYCVLASQKLVDRPLIFAQARGRPPSLGQELGGSSLALANKKVSPNAVARPASGVNYAQRFSLCVVFGERPVGNTPQTPSHAQRIARCVTGGPAVPYARVPTRTPRKRRQRRPRRLLSRRYGVTCAASGSRLKPCNGGACPNASQTITTVIQPCLGKARLRRAEETAWSTCSPYITAHRRLETLRLSDWVAKITTSGSAFTARRAMTSRRNGRFPHSAMGSQTATPWTPSICES